MSDRTLGAVIVMTGGAWIEAWAVWRSGRLLAKAMRLANWVELRQMRRRQRERRQQASTAAE